MCRVNIYLCIQRGCGFHSIWVVSIEFKEENICTGTCSSTIRSLLWMEKMYWTVLYFIMHTHTFVHTHPLRLDKSNFSLLWHVLNIISHIAKTNECRELRLKLMCVGWCFWCKLNHQNEQRKPNAQNIGIDCFIWSYIAVWCVILHDKIDLPWILGDASHSFFSFHFLSWVTFHLTPFETFQIIV